MKPFRKTYSFCLLLSLLLVAGVAWATPVTFSVDMQNYVGSANYILEGVNLNGTFNDWCGTCAPMEDFDGDGIYTITANISAGTYEYKFVIGNWIAQEDLPSGTTCTLTTGTFVNRIITVGAVPQVEATVCWQTCNACQNNGPSASERDVVFSVDMNGYEGTEDYINQGVYLNGTFNDWCGTCAEMTDPNGDGVYEITVPLSGGDHEYKFTIGGWTEAEALEGLDGDCFQTTGDFTNRKLTVPGPQLEFSGFTWNVKVSETLQGPGPNLFTDRPEDIFVDANGHLHMRIDNHNGNWYSAEVVSDDNLGYGTYTWTIEGDYVNIPENLVVGLFTWDNNTFFEQANSEVDIEFSKWGDAAKQNTLQYGVQPIAFGQFNNERLSNPPEVAELIGITTHEFTWTPTLISWRSFTGETTNPANEFANWQFDLNNPARVKEEGGQTSQPIIIPAPGATTNARINYWILPFVSSAPTDGMAHELIVRSFNYTP